MTFTSQIKITAKDDASAAFDKLSRKAGETGKALGGLSGTMRELGGMSNKLGGVGDVLGQVGTIGARLPLPLLGALAGLKVAQEVGKTIEPAVRDYAKLEAILKSIEATTPEAAARMAEIEEAASKLAAPTKFGVEDIASGFKVIMDNGYSVNEALASMGGFVKLAAAQNLDLAEATDIVSSTLNGFGLKAKESERVAAVLAMTAANSSASVQDVGESMKYIAPIAAVTSQRLEDINIALGLVAKGGLKASMAGTAIAGSIQKLAKPSEAGAMILRDLGIKVSDSTGKMRSLLDITKELGEKTRGMTDAQKTAVFTELVGENSYKGLALLVAMQERQAGVVAQQRTSYAGATKELNRQVEVMNQGASPALQRLEEAQSRLSKSWGKLFSPLQTAQWNLQTAAVNGLADALDGIINKTIRLGQVYVDVDPKKVDPRILKPIPGLPSVVKQVPSLKPQKGPDGKVDVHLTVTPTGDVKVQGAKASGGGKLTVTTKPKLSNKTGQRKA